MEEKARKREIIPSNRGEERVVVHEGHGIAESL